MKKKQLVITAIGALMVAGTAFAQAPFGGPDDVAYSKALWQSLKKANLVGRAAHMSTPYTGQHPHGPSSTPSMASYGYRVTPGW